MNLRVATTKTPSPFTFLLYVDLGWSCHLPHPLPHPKAEHSGRRWVCPHLEMQLWAWEADDPEPKGSLEKAPP